MPDRGRHKARRRAVDLLFERSKFVWTTSGRNYRLNLGNGQAVVCSPSGDGYSVLLVGKTGTAALTESPLPLGYATGTAEDFVRRTASAAFVDKEAKWRTYLASEKQLVLLRRMGISHSKNITRGEAALLIDKAVSDAPATRKQIWLIKKCGLHVNPRTLTKQEATVLISQYKSGIGATA